MQRGDAVVELRRRRQPAHAENEERLPTVTQQEFHDFLVTERQRVRSCPTLLFTSVAWLLFAIAAVLHSDVPTSHRLHQCLHDAVTKIQVPYTVPSVHSNVTRMVSLDSVSTLPEVWTWLSRGLLPVLSGAPARPGFVRNFNKVVGNVQLQQHRASVDSCSLPSSLAAYYRGSCRTKEPMRGSFGTQADGSLRTGDPAWVAGGGMQVATAFGRPAGEFYYAWIDVLRAATGQKRVEALCAAKWLDANTEELQVQTAFFNPEVRAYALVSVGFLFKRGGLVQTQLDVRAMPALPYPTSGHICVDILWALVLLLLFIHQLQEAADRKGSACNRCCGGSWAMLDWLVIEVGAVVAAAHVATLMQLRGLSSQLPALQSLGQANSTTASSLPQDALRTLESRNAQFMQDLAMLTGIRTYLRLAMVWFISLLLLRFFRGFAGQPRMAAIGGTFAAAASDLFHLAIMLVIVFENFALAGCILFGGQQRAWSTVRSSQTSALAMLFGSGDFAELFEISPIASSVWLFLFVVSTAFTVLNMCVGVLVDHHREVRAGAGRASQSLAYQLVLTISDFVWKRGYDLRMAVRFLERRAGPTVRKLLPKLKSEPTRVRTVPYDELIAAVGGDDRSLTAEKPRVLLAGRRPLPPWAPVDKELLLQLGCDPATAKHLLEKCRACTAGRPREELPAGRLFEEFENSMKVTFATLSLVGEELRSWLAERRVDCSNMEPRQRKLEFLSRSIEPAGQPLEMRHLQDGLVDGNFNQAWDAGEEPETTTLPAIES